MEQNFRNALIGTLVGAATVAVTAYVLLKLVIPAVSGGVKAMDEEEERPPVIITSGSSVEIKVDDTTNNKSGPGVFLMDGANNNLVYHMQRGMDPIELKVATQNYSCAATGTAAQTQPIETDSLTVTYGMQNQDNQDRTFTVFRSRLSGAWYLTIGITDNNERPNNWPQKHEFHLRHGDSKQFRVKSVSFPDASKCTANDGNMLKVFQPYK